MICILLSINSWKRIVDGLMVNVSGFTMFTHHPKYIYIYSNIVPVLFPSGPSWNSKPLTSMNHALARSQVEKHPSQDAPKISVVAWLSYLYDIQRFHGKLHTWHIDAYLTHVFFCESNC